MFKILFKLRYVKQAIFSRPGKDGLLHISQFKQDFEHLTDVINEGDNIRVKVTEIRRDGKVKLEFADSE